MQGFIKSFQPLLKKHKIEFFLIIASSFIASISFVILFINNKSINQEEFITNDVNDSPPIKKVVVQMSGALQKPGVYEINAGSRLKDILNLAGGLSIDADKNFFERNFNLAKLVTDQEKIYIPYSWEIYSGLFKENQKILDYNSPVDIPLNTSSENNNSININNAIIDELDSLPGVGEITAEKIIKNRPYGSINELITKKVINKTVFQKIQNLVTVN